ncbi:hypothetical protein QA601_01170 [Chitinispirillales bacterium ANBcel5]|uniref:YitT family protein n=1 Tax=Cellulosispirillum alkaliphilum TaxID=3039283 RepID=UPI002A525F6E|nr:hypothetical protein [Chitinispirillales bacterium ANBcel5]
MKMGFLFSGLFWGIILILIGLSIIIRVVFNIQIPLFRIVFALILIYLGIRVLVGGAWIRGDQRTALFEDRTIGAKEGEYNVIFSRAQIDATQPLPRGGDNIETNTVFGSSVLKISKDIPTRIKVSAVFASTSLPDGNTISFGDYTYLNPAYSADEPFRTIRANVVFGNLTVIEND